jgi:CxxC motif-containing protein
MAVMKELNKVTINDYLPINSVVIKNVLNTGADIITTAPMKKGK